MKSIKKWLCILLTACATIGSVSLTACTKGDGANLSSYDIYASYDSVTESLEGRVAFSYYNDTENEICDLKFNLYANAFRENSRFKPVSDAFKARAYYAGVNYGSMSISNVENCASWNVGGEDENILTVNLLSPVYPEERVEITISYSLSLAKINHRTGVTASCVNLGNFYPILCAYSSAGFVECPYYYCGDPFLSECANYNVILELPPEYTAATSGKLVSETTLEGRKKCSYTLKNARDFAVVLSDKFSVLSKNTDGVEVMYYYVKDSNSEANLSVATQSLRYFEKTFGEYAYPTLSVVQTGFCYGGMEYPALAMISDGQDTANTLYSIVHEIAHQWWYAMVGSDQLTNAWQDEGLAEYSTLMFFEKNPSYGFTRTGIINLAKSSYRAYFTVYSQLNGTVNTAMRRNLSEYAGEVEYNNITYNKGLILFDTLRNSIGDEKFVSALKSYFKRNKFKIASPEEIYATFINAGVDTEGFFDAFIEGKIII